MKCGSNCLQLKAGAIAERIGVEQFPEDSVLGALHGKSSGQKRSRGTSCEVASAGRGRWLLNERDRARRT